MKNMLLLLSTLLLFWGCFHSESENAVDVPIIVDPVTSLLEVQVVSSNQRADLDISKSKVISAEISLEDSQGEIQSKKWTIENPVKKIVFNVKAGGVYTLTIKEVDESGDEKITTQEIDIEIGFNYTIKLTLGGKVTIIIDDPLPDEELVVFDNLPENILKVRQTYASEEKYKIVWNPYPGAEAYRVYQHVSTTEKNLVHTTRDTSFQEAVTGQRGFWAYHNQEWNRMLFVHPVVNGEEIDSDYYIRIITYRDFELIDSNYQDLFEEGSIDKKYEFTYWHNRHSYLNKTLNDGNQVGISDTGVTLTINTTDGGPALNFICHKNDASAIEVSYKMYVDCNNSLSNRNHYARIITPYGLFGMFHHNYSGRKGLYYWERKDDFTTGHEKLSDTYLYDQWVTVTYTMNFQGNTIEMSINDEVLSKDIDFSLYQGTVIPVTLSNFDWFTGHLCVIDDLSIRYIYNSLP